MKRNLGFDHSVVIVITVLAFLLSLSVGTNYLITGFLFFVLPSCYLTVRRPELFKKAFLVSLVFTIPAVGIASYLAHTDGAWYNFSIIGIRILDSYPIDDFLWALIFFYYIVTYYEFFIDKEKKIALPKKFFTFWHFVIPLTIAFSILVYLKPGGYKLVIHI